MSEFGFKRKNTMRPAKLEYLSMLSNGSHSNNAMKKAKGAYESNAVYNTSYTRSKNHKNAVRKISNQHQFQNLHGGRRTRKAKHSRKAKHTRRARHTRKH
jgi:hypothetical protein